jgi:hypothetical protein
MAQDRFLETGEASRYPPPRDDDADGAPGGEKNKNLSGRVVRTE